MRPHLPIDAALAAVAAAAGTAWGWPAAAAVGGVAAAVHALGVAHPRCPLYGPVTWRLPEWSDDVALTFDDGPDPEVTPRVLDALAAHGLRATFFCIGVHVRRQGPLVRRLVAEGHGLGLHGDRHSRWFNLWPAARVRADLEANAAALADASGCAPSRCFRPPVGLRNPIVCTEARRLGLACITWTASGRDTDGAAPEVLLRRCRPGLRPGGILVLHDGHEPGRAQRRAACLPAIPLLARALRDRGLGSRVLPLAARAP